MRVVSSRIENYKSFHSSGEVRLAPGFNVIVGQNNVGKTALAEALGLRFFANPHRSRASVPVPGTNPHPTSSVELSVRVGEEELRRILLSEGISSFSVSAGSHYEAPHGWAARFYELLDEGLVVEITYSSWTDFGASYGSSYEARVQGLAAEGAQDQHVTFTVDPKTGAPVLDSPNFVEGDPGHGDLAALLSGVLSARIYGFSAVRFGISDNPIGPDPNLAPDASNLMQVLNLLYNGNPSRWGRYVEDVRTVLPQVRAITFGPSPAVGGGVRALLWSVDPDTEREDLAVPLSESGTGVGQVLAILYVAFASRSPRTIIIDEPQSFLHPGAVRKLFEILKGYPQHQYLITTHSPNAVTAADPEALFLVHKEGEESVVEQLDVSRAKDQTRFLREVGASLADVFDADEVLWVEGPTEEECFPLVVSEVAGRPLLGTKIVGVLSTGDLGGRRSRDAYLIYRRLTDAGGLVPPAVGFVFDREGRGEKERADLDRESGGLVAFLPRRMYENYLLNPRAIAEAASAIKGFREGGVSAEEVEGWIEGHGRESRYLAEAVGEPLVGNASWLAEVDAAKLLKDLFADLSETRVAYDKVVHGVALTRWLCENAPEELREVADLIEGRLGREAASNTRGGAA